MPAYIDRDGFPFWGNSSPQKSKQIPARQVNMMIEDARLNQVFNGNTEEIHIKQVPRPRQAKAEGGGSDGILDVGKYGSTLFDSFMAPVDQAVAKRKGQP